MLVPETTMGGNTRTVHRLIFIPSVPYISVQSSAPSAALNPTGTHYGLRYAQGCPRVGWVPVRCSKVRSDITLRGGRAYFDRRGNVTSNEESGPENDNEKTNTHKKNTKKHTKHQNTTQENDYTELVYTSD